MYFVTRKHTSFCKRNTNILFFCISMSLLFHFSILCTAVQSLNRCSLMWWVQEYLCNNNVDMEMCICLYNMKPTWRHQHSFSLDLMHLHIAMGEGHMCRGWICAPKLCHRRCAYLHIATETKCPYITYCGFAYAHLWYAWIVVDT